MRRPPCSVGRVGTSDPFSLVPSPSRCPRCASHISWQGGSLRCPDCGWRAISTDGIPIVLADPEVAPDGHVDPDAFEHKAAQVAHVDHDVDPEFEIERPARTPALYRSFLDEKFNRGPGTLGAGLAAVTALTVCGGSGMDAEALAKAGARVVTSDLSLEATKRARVRADRHGTSMSFVVADVEHLPYDNESFDLVAVHDGLHHLADPFVGLAEMARVARRWVVISEPAQARATQLAVRLGLALETESAGNRVARLDPSSVVDFLRQHGFESRRAQRYAMYYPHHPGRVFQLLSLPVILQVVRTCWRVADRLIGRWGNKMVVIGERTRPTGETADGAV
jgi:SAM-dependent methyltransferase